MEFMWDAQFHFKLGEAGEAFNRIPYPSGPKSRGQIWPMGLWIDKTDGVFYCFIHNESAEGAGLSAYSAEYIGVRGENDFRHIGLMTSPDQGRTWDFKGWIISDSAPMYTEKIRPDGITEGGQKLDNVCLGSGDFSSFANERDGYLYIYYHMHMMNLADDTGVKREAGVFVARSPMSEKGMPGTWMKFYEGSFSQPGNRGLDTVIFNVECEDPDKKPGTPEYTDNKVGQANVVYNSYLGKYIMSSSSKMEETETRGTLILALSDDLVHWTDARTVAFGRGDVWAPYYAMTSLSDEGDTATTGKTFRVFGSKGKENAIIKCDITIP
jgi:hypothetical protein